MTRRNASSGIGPSRPTIRPGVPMPAQFTAMRAGPCRSRADATAASTEAASVTSAAIANPPIPRAVSAATVSLMSRIATLAPFATSEFGEALSAKWQRHCQNDRDQFDAGILLADAGIRHVVQADAEAAQIVKAIGEFRALTELRMSSEIDACAGSEVPDRGTRRYDESLEEIDVKAESAIAVKGAFASAEGAYER